MATHWTKLFITTYFLIRLELLQTIRPSSHVSNFHMEHLEQSSAMCHHCHLVPWKRWHRIRIATYVCPRYTRTKVRYENFQRSCHSDMATHWTKNIRTKTYSVMKILFKKFRKSVSPKIWRYYTKLPYVLRIMNQVGKLLCKHIIKIVYKPALEIRNLLRLTNNPESQLSSSQD